MNSNEEIAKGQIIQVIRNARLTGKEDVIQNAGRIVMDFIEKGKASPLGTIQTYSGRKYVKTADGWKPYKEGGIKTEPAGEKKDVSEKVSKNLFSPAQESFLERMGKQVIDNGDNSPWVDPWSDLHGNEIRSKLQSKFKLSESELIEMENKGVIKISKTVNSRGAFAKVTIGKNELKNALKALATERFEAEKSKEPKVEEPSTEPVKPTPEPTKPTPEPPAPKKESDMTDEEWKKHQTEKHEKEFQANLEIAMKKLPKDSINVNSVKNSERRYSGDSPSEKFMGFLKGKGGYEAQRGIHGSTEEKVKSLKGLIGGNEAMWSKVNKDITNRDFDWNSVNSEVLESHFQNDRRGYVGMFSGDLVGQQMTSAKIDGKTYYKVHPYHGDTRGFW